MDLCRSRYKYSAKILLFLHEGELTVPFPPEKDNYFSFCIILPHHIFCNDHKAPKGMGILIYIASPLV